MTSLAGLVGTTTHTAAATGCISQCELPTNVTIDIVKQFDAADAPSTPVGDWPFTLTIAGESTATFADDSTTSDVTTGDDGHVLVDVVNVSNDTVSVTITEPQRADAQFVDVFCSYADSKANLVDSGDGSVTLLIHPSDGTPVCTFTNHPAVPVTVIKRVDGEVSDSGSTAGYDFVMWSDGGTVGIGSAIDDDGIFTTTDTPTVVNVSDFGLDGEYYPLRTFIGEVVQPGSSLTGITCEGPAPQDAFAGDQFALGSPYVVSETKAGDTVIGRYLDIDPWDPMTCTIDNTSAGISATKTASVSPVAPGGALAYTITATNSANTPLTSAQLVDVVPSSLTITGVPESCAAVQNTVTCTLGDLAVGASASVVLQTTVSDTIGDAATITNTVDVSADAALWSDALDALPGDSQAGFQATVAIPPAPIETAKVTASASVEVSAAVPATTTTAAPTTTTTTTIPPTTTTSTTVVAAEAPTTSTTPDLTGVLPTTGTDTTGTATIAGWSLLAGALLLVARRRRLQRNT